MIISSTDDFRSKVALKIVDYYNTEIKEIGGKEITVNDIATVWMCKSLKNFKGLFISLTEDNKYYEATYDGSNNILYFDVYNKEKTIIY